MTYRHVLMDDTTTENNPNGYLLLHPLASHWFPTKAKARQYALAEFHCFRMVDATQKPKGYQS